MYQALYRKWRPRSFDDVAGQEHITETLKRQVVSERLSHAYLFVGTRGTGKTSCAKILARAVNCETPVNGNPCNECQSCRGIENGSILDVMELDAASNNGVDNVRTLREEAVYTPAAAKKRIYIVDEVHMLTTAAFNALLKILEEPPRHLIFILATTELHKVPATILSRCQRFSFKRLPRKTIAERIIQVASGEKINITPEAAMKLAGLADGSMRDALSLLDQCASESDINVERVLETLGLAGNDEFIRLASSVINRDALGAMGVFDSLYKDGKDVASLLSEMAAFMRDILVYILAPDSPLISGSFDITGIEKLIPAVSQERLFYCLEIIKDTSYSLTRGAGVRIAMEMCIIKMCSDKLFSGDAAILSRIERLESLFNNGFSPVSEKGEKPEPQSITQHQVESSTINAATEQNEVLNTNSTKEEPVQEKEQAENFWQEILKSFKNEAAIYALLSDKTKISACLEGATLTINAGDQFAVSMIEAEMIMDPLKKAAKKVLERAVTIKVCLGGRAADAEPSGEAQKKLDKLSAFDIIKFE